MGLRSMVGFEATDRGDLSNELREFCAGEGESASDLVTPPTLLTLLIRAVADAALLLGVVSDKLLDL